MLSSLAGAFSLMTSLPVPRRGSHSLTPALPAFFPLVGFMVGGVILLVLEAARSISELVGNGTLLAQAAPLMGAMAVLIAAVMTRGLHWDGLADTADAVWSHDAQDRRLEIMADSATGAFGTLAITIMVVVQVAAYSVILGDPSVLGWTILAVPVMGRASATCAAWLGEPARPGGLGSTIMGKPKAGYVLIWTALLTACGAVVVVAHETSGIIWFTCALLAAPVVPHLIASRIGGVTGDVMGASIITTETVLLTIAALVTAA